MSSLAERLAECLGTKAALLPDTVTSAVWLRGRWVSLPHLSYGQWPPHRSSIQSTNFLSAYLSGEHRLAQPGKKANYKTAEWLYLQEEVAFEGNLKRKIKKAQAAGFECESGGLHLLSEFWTVYARHIHRLGSLPLPKRFFHVLLQGFDEGFAEIFVLRWKGKAVGVAYNLYVEDFYENAWFATHPRFQKLGASYFLHNHMIQRARELKAEVYSFGRSTPGSGVQRFKKQWHTVEVPLAWYKSGQLISKNPHTLQFLGPLLRLMPFFMVRWLGQLAFKYIY